MNKGLMLQLIGLFLIVQALGIAVAVNLIENMTFVRNSNSGACFGVMAGTLYGRDERTASISVVNVSCEAVQHLLVNPKPTKPTNPISNNSEN